MWKAADRCDCGSRRCGFDSGSTTRARCGNRSKSGTRNHLDLQLSELLQAVIVSAVSVY